MRTAFIEELHPLLMKVYLLLPSIIIFSLLCLPFVGVIPYLDGEVEFLIAVNFFRGKYLSNWIPYHPPLKLFLASIFFHLFGFGSYVLLGFCFGIIGLITLYFIGEKLFSKKTGFFATIMLSLSGIYLSSAVFSVNDFLLTVFLLLAFALYIREEYTMAAIMSSLAVLSKESAIVFALSIIIIEGLMKKFRWQNLLPFTALVLWIVFLHITGHKLWNSWNFSKTAIDGSAFTIVDNILKANIFNVYALENMLHLFIFNYNWVIWIVACIGIRHIKWNKNLAVITLFSILYTLIILTFQTFTIPRYVLPILVFAYLFAANELAITKYKEIIMPIVMACLVLGLFTSSDMISDMIWQKQNVFGQEFYMNRKIDGNDGITYNMQYLFVTKKRNDLIRKGTCKTYMASLNIHPETLSDYGLQSCR